MSLAIRRTLKLCLLLSLWLPFSAVAQNALSAYTQQQTQFLPVDEAYQLTLVADGDQRLMLQWVIAPEYYLYRHAFKAQASDSEGSIAANLVVPDGLAKTDEFFGDVEVYYDALEAMVALERTTELAQIKVTYQGCADAGLCYPPETKSYLWHMASGEIQAGSLAPTSSALDSGDDTSSSAGIGLLAAIAFAFLGGIILNIMPCVFPILSLKAFSFTHGSADQHRRASLVYAAGVIVSFMALASVLVAIQQTGQLIGWGFQLQNTGFVIGLAYLFTVMGLSLNGLIHFGTSMMNVGQSLTEQDGDAGNFFTGVLAVVVASPCTAPFMGTALGYALTQPIAVTLIVFAALGAGMTLPMVILSHSSAAVRALPKPGPWMDTAKNVLAFPLYLTSVWLLWVAGNQAGVNTMALALSGLVLLALAAYLYGDTKLRKGLSIILVASAVFLAVPSDNKPGGSDSSRALSEGQIAWSASVLNDYIERGDPIFVDVTADWCITCLANEAAVLFTPEMERAFIDADIPYMIADWTDYDADIGRFVQSHGRSGIPL
ncbi:MAG: protein-disulfide reductase DsbD domain-containing protein, partial [Pseudomonadota bacterium]|nr:protein-disulfide reductase DsbD domain-containing protein [Pseudomonadota bacterium]